MMALRTFVGRGGRRVDSPYTDDEAVARLRAYVDAGVVIGDFPASLVSRSGLSPAQMCWVHIFVVEHERGGAAPSSGGTPVRMPRLDAVRGLFIKAAAAGLKRPRIRIDVPDVGSVSLAVAGEASRFAGSVLVTAGHFGQDDRRFYGRIEMQGDDVLHAASDCTPAVVRALVDLAQDPAAVATAYGKRTGACCFCGIELSDARSVAMGYGPICAENFGLPWGEARAETEVDMFSGDGLK